MYPKSRTKLERFMRCLIDLSSCLDDSRVSWFLETENPPRLILNEVSKLALSVEVKLAKAVISLILLYLASKLNDLS